MRTLAVVPIKTLPIAKQRLAPALASGARRSLVQAMFADVLGALRQATAVERIVVVTADVAAEAIARGDGATVLRDDRGSGQSDAALIGIAYAEAAGFDRVVLVPGDTPLLDPNELDRLLALADRQDLALVIVPDRHSSGTNALVIRPPGAFAPAFGADSLERHIRLAEHAGIAYRTVEVASLAHDVDTPADLSALWSVVEGSRRIAPRTRGALSQLEHSGGQGGLTSPVVEV
ncbi:MAG: 2-phospho-L-lactate guanylyltransferase [Thermoleophilaceae bacterium]